VVEMQVGEEDRDLLALGELDAEGPDPGSRVEDELVPVGERDLDT
jgi:hypothetical protein